MEQQSRLYQYLATFTALLSPVTSGLHYAWSSPSIPQLTRNSSDFQITSSEASTVIIMQLLGEIPGCLIGAAIIDIIGRKRTILLTAIPYFAGWWIIFFARSAAALSLAKFLAGISDGCIFTVLPLYIGEIADPKIRGLLGASVSATWIFGMLLINVIGSYLSITMTAAICSVVPLLLLATFVWMPESPYYLIMKNDLEAARSALKKFRGTSDVEDEIRRLQGVVRIQNEKSGNVLELFKRRGNLKGLGIIVILRNGQQMSGVSAITFYTKTIFNEAGDFMTPFAATVTYVSIQCLMTAVCSLVIDKTGRKPLMVASLIGSGLFLFAEGAYFCVKDVTGTDTSSFNFVPVIALIGYVIIFHLGAQSIPLLVQGELFPTNVKALASCISEMYFALIAALFSKLFQVMRDSVGMYLPFFVFASCCVVNLIFVILFVIETKAKTLEEIQQELSADTKIKKNGNI